MMMMMVVMMRRRMRRMRMMMMMIIIIIMTIVSVEQRPGWGEYVLMVMDPYRGKTPKAMVTFHL